MRARGLVDCPDSSAEVPALSAASSRGSTGPVIEAVVATATLRRSPTARPAIALDIIVNAKPPAERRNASETCWCTPAAIEFLPKALPVLRCRVVVTIHATRPFASTPSATRSRRYRY